jgi:hypothetical protein
MANSFKNHFLKEVGTTPETVYTAGSGVQTTVIGMSISNVTSGNINVDVYLNSAGTDYYIVKDATIEPGSALVPVGGDQKLVVEQNDFIRVVSDTVDSADVILSILEIS